MDWINQAQDKDQWRAVVNMVITLQVPQKAGNFLPSSMEWSLEQFFELVITVSLIKLKTPDISES
jgi:hypothetical protein